MRRRYVYDRSTGEMVEVGPDYEALGKQSGIADAVLWNDRAYQDMGDPRFRSRTQHRAYMKERGLTVESDYRMEWKKREEQRIKAKQGHDPTRKQDLIEAIHKLRR